MNQPEIDRLNTEVQSHRIFLDVGAADIPAFDEGRVFAGNDVYIGIDAGYEEDAPRHGIESGYDSAHNRLETWSHFSKVLPRFKEQNIYFVGGKGQELPLRDNSIHEVMLGNVLGAPISPHAVWGILNELHRVLDDSGELVISENNTPFPSELLEPFLLSAGFRISSLVKQADELESYRELVKEKGLVEAIKPLQNPPRYVCIAQKVKPLETEAILAKLRENPVPIERKDWRGEKAGWLWFFREIPGYKVDDIEPRVTDIGEAALAPTRRNQIDRLKGKIQKRLQDKS
jgi:SAM-dependent methyltransferase